MIYQIRDIRGRKLLERSTPAEIQHWIRTEAVGFVEIWTLDAAPGGLIRIESVRDFQRRYRQPSSTKTVEGVRL